MNCGTLTQNPRTRGKSQYINEPDTFGLPQIVKKKNEQELTQENYKLASKSFSHQRNLKDSMCSLIIRCRLHYLQ